MNKTLKPGLTLDTHVASCGGTMGETIYTVCDSIGVVMGLYNMADGPIQP